VPLIQLRPRPLLSERDVFARPPSFACRTYTDVVRDEDLARDLQRLRGELNAPDVGSADVGSAEDPDAIVGGSADDARQILEGRYRDLIRAEVKFPAWDWMGASFLNWNEGSWTRKRMHCLSSIAPSGAPIGSWTFGGLSANTPMTYR
jgi:hypothetical protein